MDYFPLFADLRRQACLIVGGGTVATRKAAELVGAGASLTVNAPEYSPALMALAGRGKVRLSQGRFNPELIRHHILVIAATSDPETNRAVASAARAAFRLCNVVDDGPGSTFITPAIVDRSPVIVAVSSGGRAPVLARIIRQQLDQWLPAGLGSLADWAGTWRDRVRARLPGLGPRRSYWEQLLGGPAARAVLDGDTAAADRLAGSLLDGATTAAPRAGRAWLVGAGPGDPGLISVRGLAVLQQADVILHDRLVAAELLRAARREAEIICVGKTGGAPSASQDDINRLLVARVRAGLRVCRLKGGDPLIFGRGGEEALALAAAGLDYEIVPGITAASGAGACAGIPLTHRGLATAVTLVTAQSAQGMPGPDWSRLAAAGQTLVVYMGGARVAEVAADLIRHGRAPGTPAALVASATLRAQRVVAGTLADIGDRSVACRGLSPALLIVGETAALATALGGRRDAAGGAEDSEPGLGALLSLPMPGLG